MRRSEIVSRWDAAVAALRRVSSPPPRLSRWAWTADAILATVLTVGAVEGAQSRGDEPVPVVVRLPTGLGAPAPPAAPPALASGLAHHGHYGHLQAWQVALAVLATLPLVARRRYPLAVFWVVIVATAVYHLSPGFDPTFTFTACVIAAYSVTMYSRYPVLAMTSALVGAGLIIGEHKASVPAIRPGLVTFLFLIPVGLAANAIHVWKQRVRDLEAAQETATRFAVDRERARIAQELHDVVTHNVSVMVVQAGAARTVMDTAPDRAREALLAIESGGRAAMTELRHVMGLLTMDGDGPDRIDLDPSGFDPQPGLDQVESLAARIRATGVPVEVTVTGVPVPLPVGVDLAAYRVIQEALTNTVKHAAGARVTITIAYEPMSVRVEVADSGGTPTPSARSGTHRGHVGLRERLAVYGGTLDAGPRAGGGYRLRAAIPVDPA